MSVEAVREYLKQWGKDPAVMEFDVSSATVELAARALNTAPERIAKTLSIQDGEGCMLLVAAGDVKLDNAKFRARFGFKPRMLALEQVEEMTGHRVGGVCPFAVKPGVKVFTDVSLKRFATVFPAAGSANSAIELTCPELFELSGSQDWVDVCKTV